MYAVLQMLKDGATKENGSEAASMAQSVHANRGDKERALRKIQQQQPAEETLNQRAVAAIQRVRDKLCGHDFGKGERLNVPDQVERLIQQATSNVNLCQCYIGWCPFW